MSIESTLLRAYDSQDFTRRAGIFSNDYMSVKAIADAANLFRPNVKVLDLMSGPGLLEIDLKKWINPSLDIICLDFAKNQLRKIPEEVTQKLTQADARHLPLRDNSLDVVISRLALKDLTADTQPGVLRSVYNALRAGGVFVIADMISPPSHIPWAKAWLNTQHAMKQRMAGRTLEAEGVCHIPTEREWISMLKLAGFEAFIYTNMDNLVYTRSWVESRQVTEDQLVILDEFILRAPEHIRRAFYVSTKPIKRHPKDTFPVLSYKKGVHLMYPLDVIKAVKNEIPAEFNGFIRLPLQGTMKMTNFQGNIAFAITGRKIWIYNLPDIHTKSNEEIWPDWHKFKKEPPKEVYVFGTNDVKAELLSQRFRRRKWMPKVEKHIINPARTNTCNFRLEHLGSNLTVTFEESGLSMNNIKLQTAVKRVEKIRWWETMKAHLELDQD